MDRASFSLRREALSVAAADLALVGLRSSIAVVLVWGVTSSAVGRYYVLLVAARLVATPASGIGKTLRKRGSEATTDTAAHLGLAVAAVAVYALLASVGLVGASLLIDGVVPVLGAPFPAADALVLGALVGGAGARSVAHALLDARGYPARSTWVRAVAECVLLATLVALVLAGADGARPLLLANAALSVAVLLAVVAADRRVRVPDPAAVRSAARFAVWRVPSSLVGQLLSNYTTVLLALVAGSAAAGRFKTASELTILGSYMALAVVDPVFVRVSHDGSLDRDVTDTVRTGVTYAPLVGVGAAAVLLPLRRHVAATLLDTTVPAVALALGALALAKGGYGFRRTLAEALDALDRPDAVLRVRVATAAVAVPASLVLIDAHGLAGGVAGYVGRSALQIAVLWVLVRRAVDSRLVTPTLVRQLAVAVAVAAALAVVAPSLPTAPLPVAAAVVAGAALYSGALLVASDHIRAGVLATTAELRGAIRSPRGDAAPDT